MRTNWTAAVAAFCLASFAVPTDAHQQWLAPNFIFHPGESAWLSFDHTFGDQRFKPSSGSSSYRSGVYFYKSITYVTLASMSGSALASTGDPLEIVFEDHPNDLQEEKAFRVRVLASGEPLREQEVRVFDEHSEGHDPSQTCSTDSKGLCQFELLTKGRYLLATTVEGDSPEGAETDRFTHGVSVFIELKSADAADGD